MRFRLGLAIGFTSGYYLGSMAGRERYEQINSAIRKLKRSEAYEVATDRAREAVDAGVDKATDLIDSARNNGADPSAAPTTDPYFRTEPPAL
jgi:hypothetical protein